MEGKINGVRFCKVISISDDTDADRIKVRLSPEDNNKSDTELDFAFPILPKMLHIKPKVGEAVLVLLATMNDGNSQRYYIGPVISQDHKLNFDPYFCGADSFLRGAYKKFDVAPRMNPEQQGILPKDDDIVIRGRKNADIQITDDDVRIKAGVKRVHEDDKYKVSFNEKNYYGNAKNALEEIEEISGLVRFLDITDSENNTTTDFSKCLYSNPKIGLLAEFEDFNNADELMT
jgi:hypothetical protein